jgi:formate hydrogenlyase subunit 3/multisubunit Na+/H+ antiporter MnhD subunit
MSDVMLLAAIAVPLALAVAAILPAARPLVLRLAVIAPLPALMLALLAPPSTLSEPWLIMGTVIGLDSVSKIFLAFTAILWAAAAATARRWLRGDVHATGFVTCFLLAMTGNIGLILAQDVFSFYALFALMSFASFGLVVHARSDNAYRAGRLYIAFVVAGELALFAGLLLATNEAGSPLLADLRMAELSGLAVALIIGGFAVKLGIMPLHFWLPPAHGAAPVPASAVLSGAMIKAGLFGMLSSLPLGLHSYPDHATVLLAAGLVTIFAAALIGVREESPKTVLGFSSVSQMGIIALGLGAGLLAPTAWPVLLPVIVLLAAHHALAKGALFLGAGVYGAMAGARARIFVMLALALPAAALAGLVATSGALGKEALKSALEAGSAAWLPWLIVALTLSGVATTLLMARFACTLWKQAPAAPEGVRAQPDSLVVPFLGLVALSASLPMAWPLIVPEPSFAVLDAKPADPLPIIAGIVIALAAIIRAHALRIGTGVFIGRITAPFIALHARMEAQSRRTGRALRRTARRIPRTLTQRAEALRLGQTAIAALILVIIAVGMLELRVAEAETGLPMVDIEIDIDETMVPE